MRSNFAPHGQTCHDTTFVDRLLFPARSSANLAKSHAITVDCRLTLAMTATGMSDILLEARNFQTPYAGINGSYRIPISLRDYVRAALTLGFQNGLDARQVPLNVRKYRFLYAIAQYGFFEDQAGKLCLGDGFKALDPSEQGGLTYWHGTIMAKIVASRQLGVPWLVNVDELLKSGRARINQNSKERGDFVGRDRNLGWHAVEAKGRSNRVFRGTVERAKHQVSRIESVDGTAPLTRSACITDLSANPITVILEDPPEGNDAPKRMEIHDGDFWAYYYRNLVAYIERRRESIAVAGISGYTFASVFGPFGDSFSLTHATELFIGLPSEVLRDPSSASRLSRSPKDGAYSPYIGSDLVALAGRMPDWVNSIRS